MTSERPLLAVLLSLFACSAQANTEREWAFKAYLDDKEIGYHRFALVERELERELTSQARFNVKVLFINAYRYRHDAREQWRGDCLTRIESDTDDNGDAYRLRGALNNDGFHLDVNAARSELPGCVMSFAYWNPALLKQARLLNAQTGEYLNVAVQSLGQDSVIVRGQPTAAQHYRLKARALAIELWYSPAGEWLALDSLTADGKRLRYRL